MTAADHDRRREEELHRATHPPRPLRTPPGRVERGGDDQGPERALDLAPPDEVVRRRLRQDAPQDAEPAATLADQADGDEHTHHRREQRPVQPQQPCNEQRERVGADHQARRSVGDEPLDPRSARVGCASRRGDPAPDLVEHLALPLGAGVPVRHAGQRLEVLANPLGRVAHHSHRDRPTSPCTRRLRERRA